MKLCECGCGGIAPIIKANDSTKGHVKGQSHRFIRWHRKKNPHQKWYRVTESPDTGKTTYVHRIRAERALGRPLPDGVEVHHADGTRSETSHLVICQDSSYHRLLHCRMRVKEAGGNPNADWICSACQRAKPFSEFHRSKNRTNGLHHQCIECARERRKAAA